MLRGNGLLVARLDVLVENSCERDVHAFEDVHNGGLLAELQLSFLGAQRRRVRAVLVLLGDWFSRLAQSWRPDGGSGASARWCRHRERPGQARAQVEWFGQILQE